MIDHRSKFPALVWCSEVYVPTISCVTVLLRDIIMSFHDSYICFAISNIQTWQTVLVTRAYTGFGKGGFQTRGIRIIFKCGSGSEVFWRYQWHSGDSYNSNVLSSL